MISKNLAKSSPGKGKMKKHHNSTNGGVGPRTEEKKLGPSPPSIAQRTDALLQGLSLVLRHHDAKEIIIEELTKQVHHYLDSSIDQECWLKRCKYLLCYPLAKYLKNELPPAPDLEFRPKGTLRRWMKARLNAFNKKNTHFWYSWFQSKRSTLPLSEEIVELTYRKHEQVLCSPDPVQDDQVLEPIFEDPTFNFVLDKVREDVTKGMYHLRKEGTWYHDYIPKTSACYEKTRAQGGQSSALREVAELEKVESLSSSVLSRIDFYPTVYTKKGIVSNFCHSVYEPYGRFEWDAIVPCLKKPLSCTIQAVLEPNKVRVISKGEALPYHYCKGLQRILFSSLRRFSCFDLIGEPLRAHHILPLLTRAQKSWEWLSIDYSAATDGLSMKYSQRIFRSVMCNLDHLDYEMAASTLLPHRLFYPNRQSKCVEERGLQVNGQLMGSILSFPFLCLANLGVYLYTTRELRKNWTIEESLNHVKVNGDDMVYASPPEIFQDHVRIGKTVGLEMSVGKAYVHPTYLNINSQSLHCNLKAEKREVIEVGFLNTGLIYDRTSEQGSFDDGKFGMARTHHGPKEGLANNLNEILQGSLPGKQSPLLKWIMEEFKDKIQRECSAKTFLGTKFTRNLFLPASLGGMGVIAPDGFRYSTSKIQYYVAHGYLTRYPGLSYSCTLPVPNEVRTILDLEVRPWSSLGESDHDDRRHPCKEIMYKNLRHICHAKFLRFYMRNGNQALSTQQGVSTQSTERKRSLDRSLFREPSLLEKLCLQLDLAMSLN